jgi:hypothetical protein
VPVERPVDGEHRAVIDRLVGDLAVVHVGEEGWEVHLPVDRLPEGAGSGTHLRVVLHDGTVTDLTVDAISTEQTARSISARLARIRRQQRGGCFGR